MRLPTLAIIGRPNVGKSTLFNRIVGQRKAITDDQPGVTRDRLYETALWAGRDFRLMDTGGYTAHETELLPQLIADNVRDGLGEADVVVFLTDVTTGITYEDEEVARQLYELDVPVLLAVNKVDSPKRENDATEFYALGFDRPYPVSALHGLGVGDLLDAAVEHFPPQEELDQAPDDDEGVINIAIVGRPNVGKSTLLNNLLCEKRSLVSEVPGTTRDPVDALVEYDGKRYRLIDTAGIRRRGKQLGVEKYSVGRGAEAVKRSDVCLLMIDAEEGLTATDAHVFSIAQDTPRAAVLVVNKWDLVERDEKAVKRFEDDLRDTLPFLSYAPLLTISALTGLRTQRLFAMVDQVYAGYTQRVTTGALNRFLAHILETRPPARVKGRAPNILYITQADIAPPTFILSMSEPKALHFSYERFLKNRLREEYGFFGSPIVIWKKKR